MSDLEKYIKKRKKKDSKFAEDFNLGYENFKIGVLLKQARLDAGMTVCSSPLAEGYTSFPRHPES